MFHKIQALSQKNRNVLVYLVFCGLTTVEIYAVYLSF